MPISANRRVFIPQNRGRYDTSDCWRYGRPITVPFPEIYPDHGPEEFTAVQVMVADFLADFSADDYLCLTGSPLAVAVCVNVLARRLPRINLLRYDRIEHAYYTFPLAIEEKHHDDDGTRTAPAPQQEEAVPGRLDRAGRDGG